MRVTHTHSFTYSHTRTPAHLFRKYFSENGKDYFQSIAALGGNAPIQPENGQKPPVRYLVSTIVCLMFVITWAPWCLLQVSAMVGLIGRRGSMGRGVRVGFNGM